MYWVLHEGQGAMTKDAALRYTSTTPRKANLYTPHHFRRQITSGVNACAVCSNQW